METPQNAAVAQAQGPVIDSDRSCVKCGYNLRGLAYSGNCPECGTAVQFSLRGILLQFANPEYLNKVLTGHSWVLNAILVSIVLMLVNIVVAVGLKVQGAEVAASGLSIFISIWSFLGYLKLTEPDPMFTGTERPDSARQVVRIAAMVSIAANTLAVIVGGVALAGGGAGALPIVMISGALALLGYIAFAVQFFAMMNYTMWLARRVPDQWIVKRATTYRWLLPVLSTVGVLLIGLGPLIALVLYWNLLDRMRKHLKSIVATGTPANLPSVAG